MKIEAGKSYRSEDGKKWTNARYSDTAARADGYMWTLDGADGTSDEFTAQGFYWRDGRRDGSNLVAEWTDADEPAPQPVAEPVEISEALRKLRDDAAIGSLAGLVSRGDVAISPEGADEIALSAYRIADAMLRAREVRS